jgi:hypothetical protein
MINSSLLGAALRYLFSVVANLLTGVFWVSLSQSSFERVGDLWETDIRENEPTFFGWLCTKLSVYPETFGLKTKVHLRKGAQRPFIEVEPTAHPLAQEQRTGITLQRVEEIATALLSRH